MDDIKGFKTISNVDLIFQNGVWNAKIKLKVAVSKDLIDWEESEIESMSSSKSVTLAYQDALNQIIGSLDSDNLDIDDRVIL